MMFSLIIMTTTALLCGSPALRIDQMKLGKDFHYREFSIEGGQLACAVRPGPGPTVVLIPGTFAAGGIFAAMSEHLDRSFNLVIIETRGIGRSWPPPEHGSIEECARDTIMVLDQLKIDSFFVGGHSLGGMISLEIGRQFPQRIRGIISIEGWTNASARDAFPGDVNSTLPQEDRQFLLDYKKSMTQRWKPEQVTDFGRVWRRWDGASFIESTDIPILELFGDRGNPHPERRKVGIPERKNIELIWFEGASHSLWLERPKEVAEAANKFVLALADQSGAPKTKQDDFDVIVIGATPGGIATAVTASRLGRSVALVEYHRHIGGMSAGGLGSSDIRKPHVIQGFFREFVDRVLADYTRRYGADSEQVKACIKGYKYEPSVAERIFEGMVNEHPSITVLKYHQFVSADVQNHRVVAVTVKNRESGTNRTLKGKIFVDGTYEGDLYAAAGAEFRVGRESRDEFGEPHAGHIYCDVWTKQIIGGTGAGDDRVTGYTYRMCLSTDLKNQVPLTAPPAGYDRNRFLGYLEDAKSGRFDDKPYLMMVAMTINPLPNQKFDINLKAAPLAYVFVEENKGYPTADWPERERIALRIRNLALGLLWFLQHDEAVSLESRQFALQYHPARDEFADNGNFPFQLYVREARRLVGEYILTERNMTEQPGVISERRHPDAIAVGEFPIDSMPAQKRQPGDTVVLEGYLCMLSQITRPYQIPYRIMIPKTLDGVIVPVAASTSHIGYSSIRLEPTWMALGQAAGNAAHLAIKHDVEPRAVPYPELRELLKSQAAVLAIPPD